MKCITSGVFHLQGPQGGWVHSFWAGGIPHWNEIGWPSYKLLVASPLERWKVRDLGRPGNHPGNTCLVGG